MMYGKHNERMFNNMRNTNALRTLNLSVLTDASINKRNETDASLSPSHKRGQPLSHSRMGTKEEIRESIMAVRKSDQFRETAFDLKNSLKAVKDCIRPHQGG